MSIAAFPVWRRSAKRMADAQYVLNERGILAALAAFTPVLAGTIPLGIDTAGSDLDILCEVYNHEAFYALLREEFSVYPDFSLYSTLVQERATTVCNITCAGFPIEIFGQSLPVEQQYAYRHMLVEARLLDYAHADAEDAIRTMKCNGMPTEVAFGVYFALDGDPYQILLQLYGAPNEVVHDIATRLHLR